MDHLVSYYSSTYFQLLPNEIKAEILSFLNVDKYEDLYNIVEFKITLESSVFWTNIFNLHFKDINWKIFDTSITNKSYYYYQWFYLHLEDSYKNAKYQIEKKKKRGEGIFGPVLHHMALKIKPIQINYERLFFLTGNLFVTMSKGEYYIHLVEYVDNDDETVHKIYFHFFRDCLACYILFIETLA